MSYKQLEAHEREVIAKQLALGSSLRAIARRLERDVGTITGSPRCLFVSSNSFKDERADFFLGHFSLLHS